MYDVQIGKEGRKIGRSEKMSWVQVGKRFLGISIQVGYLDYAGSLWFFPVFFASNVLLFFWGKLNKKFYGVIVSGNLFF